MREQAHRMNRLIDPYTKAAPADIAELRIYEQTLYQLDAYEDAAARLGHGDRLTTQHAALMATWHSLGLRTHLSTQKTPIDIPRAVAAYRQIEFFRLTGALDDTALSDDALVLGAASVIAETVALKWQVALPHPELFQQWVTSPPTSKRYPPLVEITQRPGSITCIDPAIRSAPHHPELVQRVTRIQTPIFYFPETASAFLQGCQDRSLQYALFSSFRITPQLLGNTLDEVNHSASLLSQHLAPTGQAYITIGVDSTLKHPEEMRQTKRAVRLIQEAAHRHHRPTTFIDNRKTPGCELWSTVHMDSEVLLIHPQQSNTRRTPSAIR